ncbi:MAG: hypothetical protein QG656_1066, partial [Candidatus Hydrogenedentes bacterium]|nr:hypothetical protein [Candidatus Hydrogenedentota bacterium]
AFLKRFLEALIALDAASADRDEAIAYVAAALELGGVERLPLPANAAALQRTYVANFLNAPIDSKPVGFYTQSPDLEKIFRQDRFCQRPISLPAARVMAQTLFADPALLAQYRAVLALYAHLTNPISDEFLSVEDVLVLPVCTNTIALFPPGTSMENRLYRQLYQDSELPNENIMNRLIRAIRSGEVDLTPSADSGWYDYQIYALETLLVPEKGQEGEKLCLSKAYKERLIEAFKTILTKKRELHIKHVNLFFTCRGDGSREYIYISPDLRVEPTATYYLRTARDLRFVLNAIEAVLGAEALSAVTLEDGEMLGAAGERLVWLFYGLYLQVCYDLGMKPALLQGELSPDQWDAVHEEAGQWLEKAAADPCYAQDTRYIVPVMADMRRQDVRYWMTVGVQLAKVKADYLRRPQIEILDSEGAAIERLPVEGYPYGYPVCMWSCECVFAPLEVFIPVEVFAEATGPAAPYTRDEFRALCDRNGSKAKIVKAIERGSASGAHAKRVAAAIVSAAALTVLGIWIFNRRRRLRCSDGAEKAES